MATRVAICVSAIVVGMVGTADALKPGAHADLAKASCVAARLPSDFCTRVATEDYDTDSREWDDLRAHAQIDDGETACIAADRTADRMWSLGSNLRAALAAVRSSSSTTTVGAVGALVGRAIHTIQDNCAHHGMPNPQHAWFSLGDFCEGTDTSPDVQDDALACARTETDAMFALVADAIRTSGVASSLGARSCPQEPSGPHSNNTPSICQRRFLPGPFDACEFLGRAKDWDGIDRTWENDVAGPALRDAFVAGLAGQSGPAPICGGDETQLSRARSESTVDVSGGAPTCGRASLFCLGKADDNDNPFADDVKPEAGGCNTGHDAGLLILGAVLLLRRRRPR